MNRIEISGYAQIVIGLVGIVLTALTAPSVLDAFGQLAGNGSLPTEFSTFSGGIRLFIVLFILTVLMFLILIGLSITLSTLLRVLGANHPLLAAFFGVIGLLGIALTITLALLGQTLWIPGFVGTLGLVTLCLIACGDGPQKEYVAGMSAVFGIIFLFAGGIHTLVTHMPDRANDEPVQRNILNSSDQTSSTNRP